MQAVNRLLRAAYSEDEEQEDNNSRARRIFHLKPEDLV
jgi:hypothetical protein